MRSLCVAWSVWTGCSAPSEQVGEGRAERLEECELADVYCSRFGVNGMCVSNRCILPSGYCTMDTDCDDGNPCTATLCDRGVCLSTPRLGSCRMDDGDGVCVSSSCVAPPNGSCLLDSDCGKTYEGACWRWTCQADACIPVSTADGGNCVAPSGREGSCLAGGCAVDLTGEARNGTVCRVRRDPWWGESHRDCDVGISYRLVGNELTRAEDLVRESILKQLHYDVAVRLVPLYDGGYNVLIFNVSDRNSVRGLIDPSFVAFDLANTTARTSWRSRQAHIWITPYVEGWALPTSGSRLAMRRGRAASPLGLFGVVEVETYRAWLDKAFVRLPAVSARPAEVELPRAVGPGGG